MSLGQNIKELRKIRIMTQKELSEATGIKVAHLSRIENDEGDIKLSTIYKLMDSLKCTPNDLLLNEKLTLDVQVSAGIEKVLKMPIELKKEIVSIIGKYIYFSQIAELLKVSENFMGKNIFEIENEIENLNEKLITKLKEN